MGIKADSTLFEVFEENIDTYVPTATDLDAWTTLKHNTWYNEKITTKVGLLGLG